MRNTEDILTGLKDNFNWIKVLDSLGPDATVKVIPQKDGPFKALIITPTGTYEGIGDSRTEALEDVLSCYTLGLSNEELENKSTLEGFPIWDEGDNKDTESPRRNEEEGSCYED